jgi:F1F0 ATPase subunit 2
MPMSEILSPLLALALGVGALLGAMFFGGLWLTVRRGLASSRPGIWFMGSMLLRTGMVVTGFYFLLSLPALAASGWKILLAGLLGFLLARLGAMRLLPAPYSGSPHGPDRLTHASAPDRKRER